MVYVILSTWPPHQTKEVLKVTMQLAPIPDYITRRMYTSTSVEKGVECFDIYEFDSAKVAEATEVLHTRSQAFYSIPGFTYDIKPWMDEQEAMQFGAKLMSS